MAEALEALEGRGEGRGALVLQEACREMKSPYVRSHVEDDYQKRLATLLAKVRRHSEVPGVVAVVLRAFSKSFS